MTENVSRARVLRDQIEEDIVHSRFKPGERLDEVSLAERFDVSRTPVREAIQFLAAEGLVEVVPKRGAFVTEISLPDLVEMFEVMAELEGMCARLASRRIQHDEIAALEAALAGCEVAAKGRDADLYYYENETFHHVIYEASHNRFLIKQTKQLALRLKPYRRLQLRVPHRIASSLDEHRHVVEAILAGDEELAERRIKDHVTIQGERFTDFVASVEHGAEWAARRSRE